MFRKFGKMGSSSPYSFAGSSPPIPPPPVTEPLIIDCGYANSQFDPEAGDKYYDCGGAFLNFNPANGDKIYDLGNANKNN